MYIYYFLYDKIKASNFLGKSGHLFQSKPYCTTFFFYLNCIVQIDIDLNRTAQIFVDLNCIV